MSEIRYTNNFDFIRFIAAILVIFTHSYSITGRLDYEDWMGTHTLFPFSYYAVRIFFVTSGFLILKSLETSKSDFQYLWKRCLRILPGLFMMLILLIFVLGPIFTKFSTKEYFLSKNPYELLRTVLLYQNHGSLPGVFEENPIKDSLIGSTWTLVYEFTLYWILIVLKHLRLLKQRIFSLLVFVCCTAVSMPITSIFKGRISDTYFPLNTASFLEFSGFFFIGMVFHQYRDVIKFKPTFFYAVAFFFLCFSFSGNYSLSKFAIFVLMPYLIFYLAFQPSVFNSFGKKGDFSYGIYIYAFPIQQLIVYLYQNSISTNYLSFLTILSVLPVSYLSWHLIEKQALKFKNIFK